RPFKDRSMICSRFMLLASLLAVSTLFVVAMPAQADDKVAPDKPKTKTTLSPLHTFLGIDPTNDSFEGPGAAKNRKPSASPKVADSKAPGVAPGGERSVSGDPDTMPVTQNAEELKAGIANALQNGDQGALASLLSSFQQGSGYERLLETGRQYSLIIYLLCLIYPFSILMSESLQWLGRRFERGLTDRDRRYYARRMRRRLMLAAVLSGTVILFWWGEVHAFWWEQPQQLALFAMAIVTLMLTSAALKLIIRRAAARYPVLVIRDLHQKQL